MRMWVFSKRNMKEILLDPLTLIFGAGFPVLMLLILHSIGTAAQVEQFRMSVFAPAMAVFGLSFIMLFSALLVAKDRVSSFLLRLFASPMRASDYLIGYALPLLPVALMQGVICFGTALLLGLELSFNILFALVMLIPVSLLFIGIGLLLGTLLSDKQVGGIASVVVNIATLFGGAWFDLGLLSNTLKNICYALPFAHAIDLIRACISGNMDNFVVDLLFVLGYALAFITLATIIFHRRMKSGKA